MKPSVLIVGAGPVGLTMAAELARYGVGVRIIDKAACRSDKSKALVLWSRTLELMDRAGCAAMFVAAGSKVEGANIVAGEKRVGRLDFSTVESPFPYALMLPQSDTERLLEEHLGTFGKVVERQVEASGFTAREDGVTVVMRHPDGRTETVEAEWLVGCDGAHSMVRHALALPFAGDTLESDWILADVHVRGYPFPDTEMGTYLHEDGVLVVFPISPGRYRVIADLGVAAGHKAITPTLEQVQAIIAKRGPTGFVVSDPIWLTTFRINERIVANYRSGRVFVAGDAAHVHSPAGGQGMNTGMQDAFNLAWKLAMVSRKTCSAKLLDSYSPERSEVGAQVVKAAGRLTAIGVMRNQLAQSIRNVVGHLLLGLTPVRRAIVETLTEVSIGYHRSPLSGPRDSDLVGPEPGERIPPTKGHVPIGGGREPRFALLSDPGAATAELMRRHPNLLEPTLRPPPHAEGIWLVRPDGYVAAVAKSGDAAPLAEVLAQLI